jgi:hypothetical protein
MSPFYIKTSICGSSEWKEVKGFYVKKDGDWCAVNEAQIKTSVCGNPSEWKLYYSTTKISTGLMLWTLNIGAPEGTITADGRTLLESTIYSELRTLLIDEENPFDTGYEGNPKIPDLVTRNRFIRARNGASVGTLQSDALATHAHKYKAYPNSGTGLQIPGPPSSYFGFTTKSDSNLREPSTNTNGEKGSGTVLSSAGTETRPNNIALRPILAVQEVTLVPVGCFIWWTSNTVPDGYLLCDGSAVTTTYNELRSLLVNSGNPFGTDGSDPKLPDFITGNRFVRGAGGDANLTHGTTQGHAIKNHSHSYTGTTSGSIGDSGSRNSASKDASYLSGPPNAGNPDDETRPNCIALLPIVKY